MARTSSLLARATTFRFAFQRATVAVTVAGLVFSGVALSSTLNPASAFAAMSGSMEVGSLRANGLIDPLGIDGEDPVLSWKSSSDGRGIVQTAYEVRVASSEDALPETDVWSSGKVDSAEQLNVVYGGPDLESQTRYAWQVRTWNNAGTVSAWSAPASFETALLNEDEWTADWIGGEDVARQIESWKDYTASIDFTMDNLVLGVFARASNSSNGYMWQLSVSDGTPRIRPHVRVKDAYTLLESKDISQFTTVEELTTGAHNFSIKLEGNTIITLLDGVEIDRRTDDTFSKGFIGFRQSGSTEGLENSTIHAVNVTSSNGDILLDTDFSDGTNPFGAGTITENGLQVFAPFEAVYTTAISEPLLRTEFTVDKAVISARIYATARGLYELSLNGEKVGDHELAPGWTDYNKRIAFQSFDVTDQIVSGDNAFGAMLGQGWYAGTIGAHGTGHYGTSTSLIAQLRIDYSDGSHQWVETGSDWKTQFGPLIESDLIHGETYDARLDRDGWNEAGYDDTAWVAAEVSSTSSTQVLEAQTDQPVRVTEMRTPISVTEAEPETWIYDMGQNMVGVAEMNLTGVVGSTATIRYGEMLNPDGTLYTANLRTAKATDYYTFASTGVETYTPRFTFHGFRYVEITGVAAPSTADEVTGLVWGSDLPTTGTLESSSAMLNQLQSNITWGQRGNFLSIPTDTPARDEREGWTGDINVFAQTASYNQDTLAFLGKWLVDLQDGQYANGDVPGAVPSLGACCSGGTGWADATITVPYSLWNTYGDTKVVRDNYAMMTRFMNFVETTTGPSLIRNSGGYGDWLNLEDPTDPALLGTAYYSYISKLMGEMAAGIGETADAEHYAEQSDRVRDAFVERFVAADGTVQGDSMTGYTLALGMDMIPAERLDAVGDKYVAKLASKDFHLSTGFLGTPWLLVALTKTGHQDLAYRLLNNDTYPSWGYQVVSGATTMWERWDSLKPDGSFGDVGMNSFNHYAYGAVGDWMYQNIGGIKPTSAGYKTHELAPSIGGGLTHGTGTFDSVYGLISSDWASTATGMTLEASVPVNTTATVRIPALNRWAVTESGLPVNEAPGVTVVSETGGEVVLRVGSGTYSFDSDPTNSGLALEIVGADDALPGSPAGGILRVTNTGSEAISGFAAALTASNDLSVAPAQLTQATIPSRASVDLPFVVDVPVEAAPGEVAVSVAVSAIVDGDVRHFTASKILLTVLPAIEFESVTTELSAGDPAEQVTVTAMVKNAAAAAISGRFVVEVPAGWPTPAPSRAVTVPPGATAESEVLVGIPISLTAGLTPFTVRFVHETTTLATTTTSVALALLTPPAAPTDHVDFGDAGSENAHNLKSSGDGGISVEADQTRRYSGFTVGSWFEADFAVTPNEPFIIRGLETYDQAQRKSYDIIVNGQLIHNRLYQRTISDVGLETFQLLVADDGTLTSTGKVTIRFRYNGLGTHDPSMADVWTLPVPGDTIAPSVTLDVSEPGANGWFTAGAAVKLTAVDANSGIESVEYSTDGTTWKNYADPVALSEGTTEFSYRASDNAGNVSTVVMQSLKVDAAAPTAWAWLDEKGRIASVARDGLSGTDRVEYSVGDSAWFATLGELVVDHPAAETVSVRAYDKAGNVSETVVATPQENAPALELLAGDELAIAASGFTPGVTVRVELHSEPTVLGTSVAHASGVVAIAATVPSTLPNGGHRLAFVVVTDGGGPGNPGDGGGPGNPGDGGGPGNPGDGGGPGNPGDGGGPGNPGDGGGNGGIDIPVDVVDKLANTGFAGIAGLWLAAGMIIAGGLFFGARALRRGSDR